MQRVSARTFRAAFAIVIMPLAVQILPGAPAANAEVKPLLSGLLDRTGPPPANLESVVHSYVVNVNWSSLQPSAGSLNTASLDRALSDARNSDSRVKLRILAGVHSPAGPSGAAAHRVKLRDDHDGSCGTVPRFWTRSSAGPTPISSASSPPATTATTPLPRSSCPAAPPSTRSPSSGRPRSSPTAARCSTPATTCERTRPATSRRSTRTRSGRSTRTGLAMNPAQFVTKGGGRTVSDSFTVKMMRHCHKSLGSRCVLENNSIRSPIKSLDPDRRHPHYARMYKAMTKLNPGLCLPDCDRRADGQVCERHSTGRPTGARRTSSSRGIPPTPAAPPRSSRPPPAAWGDPATPITRHG